MATLALNLFGLYSGSGGFTNSFVLGAAGLLFGGSNKQVVEGPRQRDLSPPQSRAGNPIPKIFGTYPATCDIIWAKKIREVKKTSEESAKGTPSVENIEYKYFADFAVMICQGPIKRILQIRVNDKLYWDYNGGDEKAKGDKFGEKIGGSYFTYDAATGTYTSNNGNWRIRTGTQTQLPDAEEEADKGVGRVPAYLGHSVMHMTNLNVTNFGGRHPQITVLVEQGETNVASMASWICEEVGMEEGTDFEMCELASEHLRGFIIDERTEAKTPLEKLGTAFQCDFPERDFVIRALRRGRPVTLSIPYSELRTHDAGSQPPDETWLRDRALSLPEIVEVSHIDQARQWTVNRQPARREVSVPGSDKLEIDLSSLSLSAPQARRVAEIKMATLLTEQLSTTLHLPPKYAYLATGDPASATIGNTAHAVLLKEAQESLFGVLQYRAMGYDPDDYDWPLDGDSEGLPDTIVEATNGVYWAFIDTNAPTDAQNAEPCLLIAATVPYDQVFDNTKVLSIAFTSNGDDLEKEADVAIRERASMGSAVSPLGVHPAGGLHDGGASVSVFDDANSLTVDMVYGELSNATDAELLSDATINCGILGQEGIRWGVAEFLGTQSNGRKRYRLSHLLRGVRGTESFMDQHESGEVFLVMNAAVKTAKYKRGYIDNPFQIRATEDSQDVLSLVLQPQARNLWPYAPHLAQAVRDGSNNAAITWGRRSRYSGESWWTSGILPILGEAYERYDLEIVNGAGTVVRSLTDLGSAAYSYSAAEQTADGLTPGENFTVRVYQKSEIIGRGYMLEAVV